MQSQLGAREANGKKDQELDGEQAQEPHDLREEVKSARNDVARAQARAAESEGRSMQFLQQRQEALEALEA